MTPPNSGSDSPYTEEEPTANAVLRGLELAVEDVLDDSSRHITRTEQEKLCFFAIKEFDLPITYSWYLAGAYTEVAGEPDNAPGRMTLGGEGQRIDRGESENVQNYREYFGSKTFFQDYDLRKIWYTSKFEFLRDFYEACAPEEYLDLYLASTNIREHLEQVHEAAKQDTEYHSLADFGAGSDTVLLEEADEEDLRLNVSDLHMELAQIDELSETLNLVTRGTDIIEQVFARLTTLESTTKEQEIVLKDLGEFFYYCVWRYPALYISTQTAEGPNKDHLIGDHANRFFDFHEELLSRQSYIRDRCSDVDLYPNAGVHSRKVEEEQVAHLHEMAREAIEGLNE